MQFSSQAALYVLRFVNQTNRAVFLTGKAGTGKTTLLREILKTTHKKTMVVAPTGIAALNAGGATIHAAFHLPFATFLPAHTKAIFSDVVKVETRDSLRRHIKPNKQRQQLLRSLELLVIDEVSMLRPDLLDAIDFTLQYVRRKSLPFGGVQVLYIGDMLQLPPVIKPAEWEMLRPFYGGKYFFHAQVLKSQPPVYIELTHIYRQSDASFIALLNNLRQNTITPDQIQWLNQRVCTDFSTKKYPDYVTLTTHNAKADAINLAALDALETREFVFRPEITGAFPAFVRPVEEELRLREGAQVMFVKNDPSAEKLFFNGKTGVVAALGEQEIIVAFADGTRISVERYEWQHIRYFVDADTHEIKEEVVGTYVHYPIKLAWAITVHKSQGLTFEKAAIDIGQVFQPGQAYVAFSRLRSAEGLILLSPIPAQGIANDPQVLEFEKQRTDEGALSDMLVQDKRYFVAQCLIQHFDWSELRQKWAELSQSAMEAGDRSAIAKHKKWIAQMRGDFDSLFPPAATFMLQLQRMFHAEQDSFGAIGLRYEKAFDYFSGPMRNLLQELMMKISALESQKKTAEFRSQLSALEGLHFEVLQQLHRNKNLIALAASDQAFDKASIDDTTVVNLRSQLRQELHLAEESPEPKPAKKSTYLQTLELYHEGLSLEEIASRRKLTLSTVSGHFAKLIALKAISIANLIGEERLAFLSDIFEKFDADAPLSAIKAEEESLEWSELKWFRASMNAYPSQYTAMTAGTK